MRHYLAHEASVPIMRTRLGDEISIEGVGYGQTIQQGDAKVSLHPAGHIVGSAQVRVEVGGEVWVVSGDYKVEADQTCPPFEPVLCHGFVTETTFGLPIYQWEPEETVVGQIREWWRLNQAAGRSSIIFAYSLGKAQRIIAGVGNDLGPIVCHGAVASMNLACEFSGLQLPAWTTVSEMEGKGDWSQCLIVAPPSAAGTPWMRRFGDHSSAFASGWMTIRGARRRRAVDRGFVMSDHVDWPSLMSAVEATGAETVWTTHGYADVVARWLTEEKGLNALPLRTEFVGESADEGAGEDA